MNTIIKPFLDFDYYPKISTASFVSVVNYDIQIKKKVCICILLKFLLYCILISFSTLIRLEYSHTKTENFEELRYDLLSVARTRSLGLTSGVHCDHAERCLT